MEVNCGKTHLDHINLCFMVFLSVVFLIDAAVTTTITIWNTICVFVSLGPAVWTAFIYLVMHTDKVNNCLECLLIGPQIKFYWIELKSGCAHLGKGECRWCKWAQKWAVHCSGEGGQWSRWPRWGRRCWAPPRLRCLEGCWCLHTHTHTHVDTQDCFPWLTLQTTKMESREEFILVSLRSNGPWWAQKHTLWPQHGVFSLSNWCPFCPNPRCSRVRTLKWAASVLQRQQLSSITLIQPNKETTPHIYL